MEHHVELAHVEPRVIEAARFSIDDYSLMGAAMGEAFGAAAAVAAHHGRVPVGPAVAVYTVHEKGFDVAAGFVLDDPEEPPHDGSIGPVDVPGGEVATTTHLGSYDSLPEAYEALHAYAAQHGRALDEGTMWEEYWSDPGEPPETTKTVVFWPLLPA